MIPRFVQVACFASLSASLFLTVSMVHARRRPAPQHVVLDGTRVRVTWSDGDSFRVLRGPRKGQRARLAGYNTLESYGPVHFWGGASGAELYALAKQATALVRSKAWICTTVPGAKGGYGRKLVRCPDAAAALVRAGLAHVFAVDHPPDAGLLRLQSRAQAARRGIWKPGVPAAIVTSLHSADEYKSRGKAQSKAYNRVCDTRTGLARRAHHDLTFKPCQAWCARGSCMIYVPYDQRYGRARPACLRRGRGRRHRLVLPPHLGPGVPASSQPAR